METINNKTITKVAGILMMIFGFWLLLIPIYVGFKTFQGKKAFGIKNEQTDMIVKLVFAFCSCIIPGILLLIGSMKSSKK